MTNSWERLSPGEHELLLAGGAGIIEARLHLPKKVGLQNQAKAVVICCHPHPLFGGTMTNKVVHTMAKTFCKMGVPAIRYNFRGVGKSAGSYDKGVGESEDLLIISKLMQKNWPRQQFWLAGFSFGSWVSANCAAASGADQLLSVAPPVQYFDFAKELKPGCSWLVLMGEQDEIVNPEHVFEWINSQNHPPKLIKFSQTGHFFHGQIVKMMDVLKHHYRPVLELL